MINLERKNKFKFLILFLVLILIYITCFFKLNNLTLILLIVISIFSIFLLKDIYQNYINLVTFFMCFHVLYGLIGPITLMWIGGFPDIYGKVFDISAYLFAYTLATTGLLVGFYFCFSKQKIKKESLNIELTNKKILFFKSITYIITFGTTFGEIINFIRVGGFQTLYKGKAVYQAVVGDLFLTIPTNVLFDLSISFICVIIILNLRKNKKMDKTFIIINFILLLPFIFIKILLGQRGILLSSIIIIFLAFSYFKPIRKITKKIVLIVLICYFSLSFLYVARPGIKYIFNDFDRFSELVFKKERIMLVLNPGSNEFSCGFGNFNTLYVSNDYNFLYGKSYLNGLFNFVPGFLYPGDKPLSITYQFRDIYFPEEKERSRIAGTAFSSILEAYWNFGFIGIFIMYILFSIILFLIENKMKNKSIWFLLIYFSISPLVMSFHRSELGDINTDVILKIIVILCVYLFYLINKKNKFKYFKSFGEISKFIIKSKLFYLLNDKTFLKLKYRIYFNKKLNIKNPQTFNEKLQWLKLYDHNPKYIKMVDKYEVRDYIKKMIGKKYLIPLIGRYNNFEEINFEKLPSKFVIKCTHDSGGIVICKDKTKIDIKKIRKKINKSLKTNYYYSGREWPYKNIKPKILIEKYMEDNATNELIDYKIMCFNGKAKMLFTCSERFSNEELKVTFFDLDWNKMPFERHYKASEKEINKPLNYDKMIKFSEKLTKNIPFVRVDWYEINGKLYFGELTFYPGSGFEEFNSIEWDYKIGRLLKLPQKMEKSDE